MKMILTLILMSLAGLCLAQNPVAEYGKTRMRGNVKQTLHSVDFSTDIVELRTKRFIASDHRVDSFDKDGYIVLSYDVVEGISKNILKHNYKFGPKGNLVKYLYIDDARGVTTTTTFIYDAEENMVEEIYQQYCQHCDTSKSSIKYTYIDGRIIIKDGGSYKILYDYDSEGKIVKETSYLVNHPDSEPGTKKYIYDDTGKKTFVRKDNGYGNETSWYDAHGNIVREHGLVTEYFYDSHGNWTREIKQLPLGDSHIEGVEPVQMYRLTVREIEYYK